MSESKTFADLVRSARDGKKMTQSELAERVKCTVRQVHNIEHGVCDPAFTLALAIARVLEIDLAQVVSRSA